MHLGIPTHDMESNGLVKGVWRNGGLRVPFLFLTLVWMRTEKRNYMKLHETSSLLSFTDLYES